MKKVFALAGLLILASSCSNDEVSLAFFRAAIHSDCDGPQNFTGEDIYGYTVEHEFLGTYWQVGAHPAGAVNSLPDLGMNIFNENLETGQYAISDGSWSANSVYIFYIDENGNEYSSTSNLSGTVSVNNDGNLADITLNNVQMYNYETQETICVSNIQAQFVIN
jgi:hypothetical protein